MRRAWIITAAATVIVSFLWTARSARLNRSAPEGGTLELTERELALEPLLGESTALFLDLRPRRHSEADDDPMAWMNVAKLEALGFDCHVPATSPIARTHYHAITPRVAYVVLKCKDSLSAAQVNAQSRGSLTLVDAGLDVRPLRQKFPAADGHAFATAVVTPFWQDRNSRDGSLLPEPRVGGRIRLVAGRIFVPKPQSQILQQLRRRETDPERPPEAPPRFTAKVSWGTRYEPWLETVKRLE
jgi:hypothetical protein